MHLVWKRMERLIEELRQRDDLTAEDKFNAIMLAIDASGLKRTPEEIAWIRRCVYGAEAVWRAPRKKR